MGAIDGSDKKCKAHREKVNFKENSELKVTAELKRNRERTAQ